MTTNEQPTPARQAAGVTAALQGAHLRHEAPLATPARALAIGAHPDDVELGAGATLARWADDGCAITILVASDGRHGTWDTTIDGAELAATRAREAARAAALLGADLRLLGHPDGRLRDVALLAWQIAAAIRACRPDVVLVHDPDHPGRLHPDHRAVATATFQALADAREPTWQPGFHAAHRPRYLALYESPAPDHAEPTTDEAIARKAELLACHESQYRTTYGVTAADDPTATLVARLRTAASRAAERLDAAIPLVEDFRLLDDL
ncbi:LmbE family protein [Acidimicrobium ferrooxidans DSM 10331]|uniref:LmbE family protein n=1 Tax=Acidimicrobium ferrooxidans (strain DSM 10331 / JCM 15462 / NBRC 103882 / ICP) TaxID=525909 RepID=C7LXT5_ACIFD|nr:PIG-L family deacetylase [Acidimicrobium ferrooxidans]ACU53543.1 LmbE family protein [Acidimicrobium ferrooxidans DSM 10331]